jgi:two-component system KDP operon response regulator KdpE
MVRKTPRPSTSPAASRTTRTRRPSASSVALADAPPERSARTARTAQRQTGTARERELFDALAACARTLGAASALVDRTGAMRFVHPRVADLLGLAIEELQGQPVEALGARLVSLAEDPVGAETALAALTARERSAAWSAEVALARGGAAGSGRSAPAALTLRCTPLVDLPVSAAYPPAWAIELEPQTLQRSAVPVASAVAAKLPEQLDAALTRIAGTLAEGESRGGKGSAGAPDALLRRLGTNAALLLRLALAPHHFHPTPLDLGDVFMTVLPKWKQRAPQYALELALSGEIPLIIADAHAVELVVDALLRIAIDASSAGATVRVSIATHGDEVIASVRAPGAALRFDAGGPLPLERLTHLGLGDTTLDVSVVSAVVEAHGGRAWAQPAQVGQPGRGLVLTTTWPVKPHLVVADAPPAAVPTRSTGAHTSQPHASQPHTSQPHTSESHATHAPAHAGAASHAVEREQRVVLVVEADTRVARYLRANLDAHGWRAVVAHDPEQAREVIDLEAPDLVVLDGGLPGMEEYALLGQLAAYSGAPVVVLAHHADALACARALDNGAADWISRPFSMEELTARIRAILRTHAARLPSEREPRFTCGDLTIDFAQRAVSVSGRPVRLSKTEYKLLRVLAQHPDMVLAHDVLLERVWGPGYADATAFLWVYIRRLRSKIEPDPAHPRYILTAPGVGYRLAREAQR